MSAQLDPTLLTDFYRLTDVAGVLCNGILGGRLARARGFDFVGFAILAIMSALGGGILRDMMLRVVPVALTDPLYLGGALTGATIAFLWRFDSRFSNRLLFLCDSLCLGCWAAVGAGKTLDLGLGIMPALLMGLITGIGGTIVRDVSTGTVPRVFGGNNLYATPAFLSAGVMVIFWELDLAIIGNGVAILFSLAFVALSNWRKWTLPQAPEVTITLTTKQLRQLKKMLYRQSGAVKPARKNRFSPLEKLENLGYPETKTPVSESANQIVEKTDKTIMVLREGSEVVDKTVLTEISEITTVTEVVQATKNTEKPN